MFWIILIAMLVIWFILPDDRNQWSLLDEKPKENESLMSTQYDKQKR